MYFVYSVSPKFKLGLSLTSPYGGFLNYTDGWAGRYLVQDSELYTLNLNPSAAFRFNKWAALGVGIAIEYANLAQTVAFPTTSIDPELGRIDGQANVKVENVNVGFNIGAFSPNDKLS